MFVANQLKNIVEKVNIDEYKNSFIDTIRNVVEIFISDKNMFNLSDFSVIYFDEYTLNTNCNKEIFSTLYLEINQPNNIKIQKVKSIPKAKDKIQMPELYLSLEEIQESLFQCFVGYLDNNNIIWKDQNSICIKTTIYDEIHGIDNYYFRIIPCLTYYNQDNVKGIMYKSNGGLEIEYPELAIDNFMTKNELTDDLFRQVILIFKNILLKEKTIEKLPSEIIETIVYNIPTEMFLNDSKETLLNMINFLRNNSIKDFQTIDEQDKAFVSIYRSMSLFYAKHVIKIIEKYLLKS